METPRVTAPQSAVASTVRRVRVPAVRGSGTEDSEVEMMATEPKPPAMQVSFTRTGPRRDAVRAARRGFPTVHMDPAPGFDERLPHDLIHFVVERARAQRRTKRRSKALAREGRADGELSEHAASVGHHERLARSDDAAARGEAASMASYVRRVRASLSSAEQELLTGAAVDRICRRLDEVSARWRELGEGESITLSWPGEPTAGRGVAAPETLGKNTRLLR